MNQFSRPAVNTTFLLKRLVSHKKKKNQFSPWGCSAMGAFHKRRFCFKICCFQCKNNSWNEQLAKDIWFRPQVKTSISGSYLLAWSMCAFHRRRFCYKIRVFSALRMFHWQKIFGFQPRVKISISGSYLWAWVYTWSTQIVARDLPKGQQTDSLGFMVHLHGPRLISANWCQIRRTLFKWYFPSKSVAMHCQKHLLIGLVFCSKVKGLSLGVVMTFFPRMNTKVPLSSFVLGPVTPEACFESRRLCHPIWWSSLQQWRKLPFGNWHLWAHSAVPCHFLCMMSPQGIHTFVWSPFALSWNLGTFKSVLYLKKLQFCVLRAEEVTSEESKNNIQVTKRPATHKACMSNPTISGTFVEAEKNHSDWEQPVELNLE